MTGQRRLADVGVPDARRQAVLRRHLLSRTSRATGCRPSARSSRASRARGASSATSSSRRASRLVGALVEQQRVGAGAPPTTRRRRRSSRRCRGHLKAASTASTAAGAARPKFPQPMTLEFLLRRMADRRPRARARWPASPSTRWPTAGSTTSSAAASIATRPTPIWLVPHFEQMLYDNAQLARVYLHAWALTGEPRYREVAEGDARLHAPRAAHRRRRRSPPARTPTRTGSKARRSPGPRPRSARSLGDDADAVHGRVRRHGRRQLGGHEHPVPRLAGRAHAAAVARGRGPRGAPGLAPRAAARASAPTAAARPRRQGARRLERAGDRARSPRRGRLLGERALHRGRGRGRPRRSWPACSPRTARSAGRGRTAGRRGRASSRTTPTSPTACSRCTRRRSTSAGSRPPARLMDRVLARFADPAGGFFDTADDHERLVARPKDVQDNAVPSGNAMATLVLLRLAAWTGDGRYRDAAERAMRTVAEFVAAVSDRVRAMAGGRRPRACAGREVAIVGDPADPATQALLAEVASRLPPEPGRGRARRTGRLGRPVAGGSHRRRRPRHRLRLSRVRLPAAGDRSRSASPGAAGGPGMSDDIEVRLATTRNASGRSIACVAAPWSVPRARSTCASVGTRVAGVSSSAAGRTSMRRSSSSTSTPARSAGTSSSERRTVTSPIDHAGVVPRPAATVVLMRPGRHGPEVLLGRRPSSMAFAPDVHVFPGGRVDPADAHPRLIARSVRRRR